MKQRPRQKSDNNFSSTHSSDTTSDEESIETTTMDIKSIFASDKTSTLIKKYFVYKLMGSNFFINHSLGITNNCYRVLGIPVTNVAINSSVGSLFTSGETLSTLMQDIAQQEAKNIGSLAGCAVEGLAEMNEDKILEFYHLMLDTIG